MFCKNCGSILMPAEVDGKRVMKCRSCGEVASSEVGKLKEKVKEQKAIEVVEKDFETMPLIKEECPKCGHREARFWTVQTRAGDEPETKFMKCEKCKHVWRDYN